VDIDWAALRAEAAGAMRRAYAPYSNFPVGVAGLVDDGRMFLGCNVENASYGLTLCAECGLVSALVASGGGRLVAVACVDAAGRPLMPCGRCRQLLWEHGGPHCLVDAPGGPMTMADLLPDAFDQSELGRSTGAVVPSRLVGYIGRGTVFVHPDMRGGERVWTGYWERGDPRSAGAGSGILDEGPIAGAAADLIEWGRARTPRVVVVDAEGTMFWAGQGDPPDEIGKRWG